MTSHNNRLFIDQVDSLDLAKTYGTPLYVLSERALTDNYRQIQRAFSHARLETEIIYASKAFSSLGIYDIMNHLGASIDVVSGGELYTAHMSQYPMDQVYFHGNNKSMDEIKMALDYGVKCLVVDNLMELYYLASLDRPCEIMLRVNPGIEASTHPHIQTGMTNNKFGISFESYDLKEALTCIQDNPQVSLLGLHCHIGSQISDGDSYLHMTRVILDQVRLIKHLYDIDIKRLNLGGGFSIAYTAQGQAFDFTCLQEVLAIIDTYNHQHQLSIQGVMIEPGRSIIGHAGTTLYQVGFSKTTSLGRHYLFLDGGMTDNLRPALYQAPYTALVANRMEEPTYQTYTLAGKCCESGDILIEAADLPKVHQGDLVAITCTGAYNYSMASNYNRIPRPPVILVTEGDHQVLIQRESYDDLIRNDLRRYHG